MRTDLPQMPASRPVTILPDGKCRITVPEGKYSESWAKRVTGADPTKPGGYGILGEWLKCGQTISVAVGDVIAVASKESSGGRNWRSQYRLYVVTPFRLVTQVQSDKVSPRETADLMALSREERVTDALQSLLATAEDSLTKILTLRQDAEPDELTALAVRADAWLEIRDKAAAALTAADPETNIVDLDSAAKAIILVGYRELAKRWHPDRGGNLEVMQRLSDAKAQLVEILSMIEGGQ